MKTITRTLQWTPDFHSGSICSPEEMLLFDIETTGLSKEKTQVYLIGCGFCAEGKWQIRQWLTESASDEVQILEEFMEFAKQFPAAVTFNGERFDVPYLAYKADYYGIPDTLQRKERFDLYARMKTARKLLSMPSMSQKSIEQFLGIARDDLLDGGKLIPVYYEYEKSLSRELEDLLLLHNFDDIQGMLKIIPFLSYAELMEGRFSFSGLRDAGNEALFSCCLDFPVPKAFCVQGTWKGKGSHSCFSVEAEGNQLRLRVPVIHTVGKIPLENVSDYYYLVEEDRVIHKDVAMFLERSRRVKATRKNCFIKKEGNFVLQPKGLADPCFFLEEDPKGTFGDFDELKNIGNTEIYKQFVQGYLDCFL